MFEGIFTVSIEISDQFVKIFSQCQIAGWRRIRGGLLIYFFLQILKYFEPIKFITYLRRI